MLEELRAEREAHVREAEAALAAENGEAIAETELEHTSTSWVAAGQEPAAPDASLVDAPYSHRGLTYPLGRAGPDYGAMVQLADGVGWTRSPVPGSLNHINLWLLTARASAIVDTGIQPARDAWETLLAGPLAGRPASRVICTHFHPDHLGMAGWLAERFGVRLWMTRGEWLFARMLTTDICDTPPQEAVDDGAQPAGMRSGSLRNPRVAGAALLRW